MVSANLSYRNYVPWNYFAIECSDIEFYGNSSICTLMNNLTSLITYDKSEEHQIRIDKLLEHKKTNYIEWMSLQKEIKDFKRKHLLWMLSKELREEMRGLRTECDRLGANDEHLSLAIDQLDNNRYHSASEKTRRYKHLLGEFGFTCRAMTKNESGLHEEVYESTCSDEELRAMVEKKIEELKAKQDKAKQKLAQEYSQADIITSREIFYDNALDLYME